MHTGGVLHLEHDMLEYMSQPGALVFRHAADESTRFAVAAAMLTQARQSLHQRIDERLAQPHRRPCLEHAEVHLEANHGEVCVVAWPDVDVAIQDLHQA